MQGAASLNQRWLFKTTAWRAAGEVIATAQYEVAELKTDNEPKAFIAAHHYLGSYPAARRRFGLFRRAELVGVAVFSHPCNNAVLTNCFRAVPASDSMELGRFVLLNSVPGNGETWFLGRCFECLRFDAVFGIVSFSDPVPRKDASGRLVMPGHVGTIYQAHNGVYLGRATPRTLRFLPDGTALSDRALDKIRRRERGWRYAVEQLRQHGADAPGDDLRAWLAEWTRPSRGIVRRMSHPGNHRYAWILDRRQRHRLPQSLPYPKQLDVRALAS